MDPSCIAISVRSKSKNPCRRCHTAVHKLTEVVPQGLVKPLFANCGHASGCTSSRLLVEQALVIYACWRQVNP